jgi:hypothetical protein
VLHLLSAYSMCVKKSRKISFTGIEGAYLFPQLGQSCVICVSVQHLPNVIKKTHNTHGREITPKREKSFFVLHTLKRSTTSLSVFCMTPDFHSKHTHTHTHLTCIRESFLPTTTQIILYFFKKEKNLDFYLFDIFFKSNFQPREKIWFTMLHHT